MRGLPRKSDQYSYRLTAHFQITDKTQGGNIGDASVNYYAEDETEAEAIAFYISNYNKHHGTQWELVEALDETPHEFSTTGAFTIEGGIKK